MQVFEGIGTKNRPSTWMSDGNHNPKRFKSASVTKMLLRTQLCTLKESEIDYRKIQRGEWMGKEPTRHAG